MPGAWLPVGIVGPGVKLAIAPSVCTMLSSPFSRASLICNNAPRRLLIGCPEDRDPGVDLAQAGTCRDQHAIGRQRAQLGGMSVEGGTLGVGHGGYEVIARRVQEKKDPFAHTPILPSQQPAMRGHGRSRARTDGKAGR
jgi:hypothetical protein